MSRNSCAPSCRNGKARDGVQQSRLINQSALTRRLSFRGAIFKRCYLSRTKISRTRGTEKREKFIGEEFFFFFADRENLYHVVEEARNVITPEVNTLYFRAMLRRYFVRILALVNYHPRLYVTNDTLRRKRIINQIIIISLWFVGKRVMINSRG